MLKQWLQYRSNVVTRRLEFHSKKSSTDSIFGWSFDCLQDLDEVIRIIQEEDKPKEALVKKFRLSEAQANSILDLRLRRLARLEELKLTSEKEKRVRKQRNRKVLGSVRLKSTKGNCKS